MSAPVPDFDTAQLRQMRDATGQFGEDGFLPCAQLRQINGRGAKTDAALLGFFRGVDLVRGVKQGLGRYAAAVEADAAETFVLLDEDDFPAQVGSVEGGRVSAGSRADDDDFGFGWVHGGVGGRSGEME